MSAPEKNHSPLRLVVNGQALEAPVANLAELLAHLGVGRETAAAELNQAIVPPAAFAATALSDGDQVELVYFVGGG